MEGIPVLVTWPSTASGAGDATGVRPGNTEKLTSMRLLRKVWLNQTVLLFCFLCTVRGAQSQTDLLSAGSVNGKAGERVTIPITLSNSAEVAGLQLAIASASSAVTIDSVRTTERSAGMTIHHNPANGKILMIDFSLQHLITPGNGPILNLRCSITATAGPDTVGLLIREAILSDLKGKALPVKVTDGRFVIAAKQH